MTEINKDGFPAPIPEILTKTQQAFADFIARHVEPSQAAPDSRDARSRTIAIPPIAQLDLASYVHVGNPEVPEEIVEAPYNVRRVSLQVNELGEVATLGFSTPESWFLVLPDGNEATLTDEEALPVLNMLLEIEKQAKPEQPTK